MHDRNFISQRVGFKPKTSWSTVQRVITELSLLSITLSLLSITVYVCLRMCMLQWFEIGPSFFLLHCRTYKSGIIGDVVSHLLSSFLQVSVSNRAQLQSSCDHLANDDRQSKHYHCHQRKSYICFWLAYLYLTVPILKVKVMHVFNVNILEMATVTANMTIVIKEEVIYGLS